MTGCGFLCINPALCLLSFLNLWINVSHQIWETSDPSFVTVVPPSFFFWVFNYIYMLDLWILSYSTRRPKFFPFSLSLLFRLDNFLSSSSLTLFFVTLFMSIAHELNFFICNVIFLNFRIFLFIFEIISLYPLRVPIFYLKHIFSSCFRSSYKSYLKSLSATSNIWVSSRLVFIFFLE